MGLRDRLSAAVSQARGAVAAAARAVVSAPAERARAAAVSALGRAETALQSAARAAGLGRAAEATKATERAAAAPQRAAEAPTRAEPARAEAPAAPPGGERGGEVFTIGGSAVTSGSNEKQLADYAVAAAAFADKLRRSTLDGALPFAVAVDAKGREVNIPPDVFAAGPDAVADYLAEKIREGKLGERVSIRAKRFQVTEDYEYEPPDDGGDWYGESSTYTGGGR